MKTDFLEGLVGIRQGVMVLNEKRFRLDVRKKLFAMMVVKYWTKLPRDLVDAPCQETLKIRLDGALRSLI